MLKMSFYDGTLDRGKLVGFITTYQKPIFYTYGLKYRNPTTYNKLITREKAIKIVEAETLLDANEFNDGLYLNAYSTNDMF